MSKYIYDEINLEVNTASGQQAVKAMNQSLVGLTRVLRATKLELIKVFSGERVVSLNKELLVLRLSWGKLLATVQKAIEPIAAVAITVLTRAIFAATRLSKQLGETIRRFFGVSDSAQAVEAAVGGIEDAAGSAAKAMRSLAGFDQLERIGSEDTREKTDTAGTMSLLTAPVMDALAKVRQLLDPILQVDLVPLWNSLLDVAEAAGNFAGVIADGLRWLWDTVLLPGYVWVAEKLAPLLLRTMADGLNTLTSLLIPLQSGLQGLLVQLKPVAEFLKETLLMVLLSLQTQFQKLTMVFSVCGPQMEKTLLNIGVILSGLWQRMLPILMSMRTAWATAFDVICSSAAVFIATVIDGLYGVTEFLSGIFTGNWEQVWEGIGIVTKAGINGLIGMINVLLIALQDGVNRIIYMINSIKFTFPDWVPELGGKTLSIQMTPLTGFKIPYLAQGAVLPANRPFLAMVGDQRHGTNIEAPLATIQEAVANVMGSQTGAMMAGFEASVQVQQQILEAVLGICIGDDVIANACDRYHRKMAVIKGG